MSLVIEPSTISTPVTCKPLTLLLRLGLVICKVRTLPIRKPFDLSHQIPNSTNWRKVLRQLVELGVGGKGETQPWFSSSGTEVIDSGFYLEYRDIQELWENVRLVLEKYRAHSPY
ncbi:hypothetical protein [Vibrio splendidus]|uniref:hypothetical protein n=1 Tax=Vibrio splendidus TaxID=29497 RepID=UPI001F51BC47|nr:hypothetical protein [Vibrio splendidus]